MIKIMLACIVNHNFGDSVIADNTSYLLKQIQHLMPLRRMEIIPYNILSRDLSQISYVDAIIFAGGGIIKYKYEKYHEILPEILEVAQDKNIPVYFNSVGVEGYNGDDERCQRLKKAINYPCVKGFGIRDDYALFCEKYIENSLARVTPLFDPAVFCKNTYKNIVTQKKSDYIGLGIAREGLFIDNEIPSIDRAFLMDFWKNLVTELESRGMKWKIFTNGAKMDEKFAEEILDYIGHGEKVPTPLGSQELVSNIRQFRAVIACRLHSNIIAYSLEIPSIGLVWNDKLTLWGEKIGYPERFLRADEIQASHVADCLERALREGCTSISFHSKSQLLQELHWFVKNYCVSRKHDTEQIPYNKYMMAVSLGTKDLRYKNMNTLQSMDESWKDGYRNMEVDIRLTSEGELVCLNGWSSKSYETLGVHDYIEYNFLSTKDFLSKKYYGRFPTATFRQFLSYYKSKPFFNKITLVIDIGKPKDKDCEKMMEQLCSLQDEYSLQENKIIIRLQTKKHVTFYKASGLKYTIAYELPGDPSIYDDIMKYCQKEKIKWITATSKKYTDETAKYLSDKGMKTIVFSYSKPGDMIDAIKKGAVLVGSTTYSVKYLKKLTQ